MIALSKETGKPRKACKEALIAASNDYDTARAALLPPPEPAPELPPEAPAAAIPGIFEPAARFEGGRPGWMFQRGPLGLGYYRDKPMNAFVPKQG